MIRLATEADAKDIAGIYNENLEEQGFANCDLNQDTNEARAKMLSRSNDRYPTFVYLSWNNEIQGWSSLKPLSARPCWPAVAEIAVYVKRTSRNGLVALLLLKHLIDEARARGFTSLIAIVLSKNKPSLRGLSAVGFVEAARLRDAAFLHDQWLDIVWMQKDLTSPEDRANVHVRYMHDR